MKTYKNRKADLEPKRAGFFAIGLVLACGLTLCAFGWRAPGDYLGIAEDTGTTIDDWDDPVPPIQVFVDEPQQAANKKQQGQPQPNEITIEFEIDHSNQADDDDLSDLGDEGEIEEGDTGEPEVVYIPVLTRAERMPSFPGGEEERMYFLSRNLKLPFGYNASGSSKVTVEFVVWTDGSIRDVKVVNGSQVLANEVLRVVGMMPTWIPGMQADRTVPVRLKMPVTFNRG